MCVPSAPALSPRVEEGIRLAISLVTPRHYLLGVVLEEGAGLTGLRSEGLHGHTFLEYALG